MKYFASLLIIVFLYFWHDIYSGENEIQLDIEKIARNMIDGESVIYNLYNSEKICFQSPYISKAELERISGEAVWNFRENKNDAQFGMHIFSKNKEHTEFLMGDELMKLNYKNLESLCKKTNSIKLEKFRGFVLVNFWLD